MTELFIFEEPVYEVTENTQPIQIDSLDLLCNLITTLAASKLDSNILQTFLWRGFKAAEQMIETHERQPFYKSLYCTLNSLTKQSL